ncbi:hypothetical protein LTR84_010244 [Exophiala bonariae]|uniref:Uncharacterized protein n=1 Tax=Exophiala bonariae TaxID=1690606 RepID=A0AAV9MTX4_9EURO|nr:hypothetical protein LTR84_010244 [Exophiala bonariae]
MTKLEANRASSSRMDGLSKSEKLEISAKEFDASCVQFEKDIGAANYQPFVDSKGFVYLLTLVRKDKLRDRLEKHRVKVRYAPYCISEHQTSYEISHQNPHSRRADSDPHIRLDCDKAIPSIEDQEAPRAGGRVEVGSAQPRLPMCPVPLYYFPKPYPYSAYPVVAGNVPSSLSMSNPRLRVRVPDPWAQCLQLFEYQAPNDGSGSTIGPKRTKEYACYTIYSRPGHRHVETLAPPGSTFDFAWNMFQKMFKQESGGGMGGT